ncbi:MAG: beta-ketoacyl-ACP reductase [Isosphaeraceae bacterium]|jgi:NAD(P)-dependent dehydrogenase (short-subunit alcohol dehydrogenase family)|nr:MAG: beta-ketoacyl-ACP reductase [Isosphaeraceae bacterium]
MKVRDKIAVITGAASGIGQAVAAELAEREVKALALVDRSDAVIRTADMINDQVGERVADAFIGDVTDAGFRRRVFDQVEARYGTPRICVPAAGITRDRLAVKLDKETGRADIYPLELFEEVLQVNLVAPTYWALEMIGRIAEERARAGLKKWSPSEEIQGTIIFIGSISSQGIPGQVAYSATKAGLEGVAATLAKEAIYYGVRAAVIHPGFTDTPMVRALGEKYINENILPHTQLKRLIRPEEIADAIYFLICNSAVSGELWADAGWHPTA